MGAPLLPWVPEQFFDADGAPLAGGFLYFYTAGTTTPEDVFKQSDLDPSSVWTQPIELGADGRPTDPIFLSPVGYKVVCQDSTAVQLWEVDDVSDPGYIYSQTYGTLQTDGPGAPVTTGYQILATDRYVPVDTTGNPSVLLPAAEDFAGMVIVKLTVGAGTCAVTPDGADTIDGVAAALVLPASATPDFTTASFISDGVSAWVVASRYDAT